MSEEDKTQAAAAEPAPPALTRLLLEEFGDKVLDHHVQHGQETVVVERGAMLNVLRFLKEDPRTAFEMMIDFTAVDHQPRTPRFEAVYHLKSLSLNHRLRVKVPVPEDAAEVDTVSELWACADWYEREMHEMYGIDVKGHPNLKPLLMYEGFEGHPLRKDYDKFMQQPLVPMRAVKERYDYHEYFRPVGTPKES